jgi:hypothetical protein
MAFNDRNDYHSETIYSSYWYMRILSRVKRFFKDEPKPLENAFGLGDVKLETTNPPILWPKRYDVDSGACSTCYGSGYGIDNKTCPGGCKPLPQTKTEIKHEASLDQVEIVNLLKWCMGHKHSNINIKLVQSYASGIGRETQIVCSCGEKHGITNYDVW